MRREEGRERMIEGGRIGLTKASTTKLWYTLFILPFLLAYAVWRWFAVVAESLIFIVFRYVPTFHHTHWLWYVAAAFLYSWYIFFSIGIGGCLVVAAWLWRRKDVQKKMRDYPTASFIVPAYNEESQIAGCITSLFQCAGAYPAPSEVIVIDDGSTDLTYETACTTVEMNRKQWPHVKGRIIRHTANLGRAEAVHTGVTVATREVVCVVDADSWWEPTALSELVKSMGIDERIAATGYIHPTDGKKEKNVLIIFQQQEYSQALAVFRCAQALGGAVFIVPGAIGLQRADKLRDVLDERNIHSVTEDLETTLQMQKKGFDVGYSKRAQSKTVAPTSLNAFWNQRLRWFMGGLHNMLEIHREMLFKRRWTSLFLWYSLLVEYGGALIELLALFGLPLLFWFAPDRTFFIYNAVMFLVFVVIVGTIHQAIALKFAYGQPNHKRLLLYTPFYIVMRFLNVFARCTSLLKYAMGYKGTWHKTKT